VRQVFGCPEDTPVHGLTPAELPPGVTWEGLHRKLAERDALRAQGYRLGGDSDDSDDDGADDDDGYDECGGNTGLAASTPPNVTTPTTECVSAVPDNSTSLTGEEGPVAVTRTLDQPDGTRISLSESDQGYRYTVSRPGDPDYVPVPDETRVTLASATDDGCEYKVSRPGYTGYFPVSGGTTTSGDKIGTTTTSPSGAKTGGSGQVGTTIGSPRPVMSGLRASASGIQVAPRPGPYRGHGNTNTYGLD
jgi:hypothetical protein